MHSHLPGGGGRHQLEADRQDIGQENRGQALTCPLPEPDIGVAGQGEDEAELLHWPAVHRQGRDLLLSLHVGQGPVARMELDPRNSHDSQSQHTILTCRPS